MAVVIVCYCSLLSYYVFSYVFLFDVGGGAVAGAGVQVLVVGPTIPSNQPSWRSSFAPRQVVEEALHEMRLGGWSYKEKPKRIPKKQKWIYRASGF